MKGLLKNKKLAVYILTVLIVFQVVFLLLQFFILGNQSGLPKSVAGSDSSILPFLFLFVFLPSVFLSKKNKMSERKRALLMWGLVILAVVVLSLMVLVLAKT